MKYRWDQGRLLYFQYNVLRDIASVFDSLEGISPNQDDNLFRRALENTTGMPFSPSSYKVWRNYKRVFECSMLGTTIGGNLFVSNVAKSIINSDFDVDSYLAEVIRRFRYPFPAFTETYKIDRPVYPFCAFIKFMISQRLNLDQNGFELKDFFQFVIGNNLRGTENLSEYAKLTRTNRSPIGDEKRQVREMLMFLGQMSIFKIINRKIYLDFTAEDLGLNNNFIDLASPIVTEISENREIDFTNITSTVAEDINVAVSSRENIHDNRFIEGKKRRVTHLKIERSPLLRKMYFKDNPHATCDMCSIDTKKRYPWTNNLLELHHILPLSASLSIEHHGTALVDVVPLCPNCHRAVHSYYRYWFRSRDFDDFVSKKQAIEVYQEAKTRVV
ncbi:MAG: HNH endonuclease [Phaeodactylibacter xiamenensis]|uniref:HNH domain-containing protein n=1 Tax=Phaeodactylibacter xiamenensis TaxID=1524460 RepID=A0A098S6X9_9BACT|nr:HNH endonuclease [Phaeodactylibacter xiamenensis]KGE87850.1 hypothetical protein IX84_12010 [Phaeodactylibacter xiamenensis]MCR9051901.1 HNH endonuclease [bacterium]